MNNIKNASLFFSRLQGERQGFLRHFKSYGLLKNKINGSNITFKNISGHYIFVKNNVYKISLAKCCFFFFVIEHVALMKR